MLRRQMISHAATVLGCVALLVTACAPTVGPVEEPTESPPSANVSLPFDIQAVIRQVSLSFRSEQGAFTGDQQTYSVRVGEDGTVRFSPRHWPESPGAVRRASREERARTALAREPEPSVTGAPLEVRTVSLSLGGRPLARTVRASVREDGALALERGPVVEVLRNGDEGVEQRWELASRPEGTGDLEVRVALSGLEYVGSSEQGHHYVDRQSGLGVRYGKATWVDARGVRTAVEPVREGGALVMRVPARVLEDSAWPAVLDPVISPEISPGVRVSGPIIDLVWSPSVAYAGGVYLVAWEYYSGSTQYIQAARVQASTGAVLDTSGIPQLTGTTTNQSTPSVTTNGTDFLVVWSSTVASGNSDIYGMRVKGSTGQKLDSSPLRISSAASYQSSPVAAYAGGNYFVAWQDSRSSSSPAIYGARVSASSGTVFDTSGLVLASSTTTGLYWPAIASDGSTLLVTWSEPLGTSGDYDVQGARVRGSDGVVLGRMALSTASGAQRYPAVSFVGGHFLVVWEDQRAAATWADIYGTRVRASDGVVLDPAGLPLVTGPANQVYGGQITVGSDASHFLVLWTEVVGSGPNHVVQGARVGTDGVVVDTPPVALSEQSPWSSLLPAVAFDGSNFLVLWGDSRTYRYSIYGNRVRGSDLTRLDTPPLLVGGRLNSVKSPVVAHGDGNYLVVWTDSRDREGRGEIYGVRVRASDGVVLDPQGIQIGTGPGSQRAPAVASEGSRFLVVWEDDPDNTSSITDIRGAWVRGSDGVVSDGSGFVISNAARNQGAPKVAFGEGLYFVAWQDSRGTDMDVYGTRIRASDGAILEPAGFVVGSAIRSQSRISVAYGAGVFLAAWEDRRTPTFYPNIYAARVRASDGVVLDPAGLLMLTSSGRQEYPAVAFDGSNFLTVWRISRPTGGVDVYGQRVRPSDGVVLDSAGRVLYTGAGAFETFPALGFDGSTYLLVCWDNRGGINRLDGVRIRPDGTLVDTTPFIIATMSESIGNSAVPSVASWGQGRFLVAYETHDAVSQTLRGVMRLVSDPVNGSKCASGTNCTSGYCVEGVCCNSACAGGTCGSGTCVPAPPRITCPADVVAEATSASGALVNYPAATATGSAPLSLAYSQSSGTSFPLAATTVTATVTDGLGRTDSCAFSVTVRDTTPPTLTCPTDLTAEATSTTGATVSYAPASASDAVSTATVSYSQASGSDFPVGKTVVNVSASDGAGNTSSCGFSVTVRLPPAPEVSCPADVVAEATSASGALVNYPAATATGSAPLSLAYSQESGTSFPLAATTVTATVTDGLGRTDSCSFSVTVRDTTPPTLTCPTDLTAEATSTTGATVSYAPASASDTVSAVTVSYSQESGSHFPVGTTVVNVSASDGAGNTSSCGFSVTVRLPPAPQVSCPADVVAEATNASGAVVSYAPAMASGSAPLSLAYSQESGTSFPVGTTTVTATVTDGLGRTDSCAFSVTVRDTTAPALSCPADVSVTTSADSVAVEYPAPTTSDTVSSPVLGYSHASGELLPPGDTRVTVTARDAAGNHSTCSFVVSVNRSSSPEQALAQGCGCGAASGTTGGFGWGALLLLSWTVTRRRLFSR